MFKLHRLSAFLITSLCLLIVAFSYLTRKPLCIDSKLVDKIDRISAQRSATIYKCSYVQHVDYNEKFANEIGQLSRRLKKLEQILEWSDSQKHSTEILIVENEINVFKANSGKIILSEDVYLTPGQLEKAILIEKMRSSEHYSENKITEDLLANFLMQIGFGISTDNIGESEKTPQSVRGVIPNFSKSLIEAYDQLDTNEQITLSKALFQKLTSLDWGSNPANSDDSFGSVFVISSELSTLIKQTVKSASALNQTMAQNFITKFESQLSTHGLDENSNSLLLDTIFIFDKGLKETTKVFLEKNNLLSRNLSVGVINGDSFWLLPENKKPFSNEKKPEYRALRGVYISCSLPPTDLLLAYADKIQKLLVISDCNNVTSLKFDNYLKMGIKGFAIDNKDRSFVQIHLPSMLMAMQKDSSIINPISLVLTKNWSHNFFHQVGWQDPVYDEMTGAFKAKSSIEVIDWFR